MPSPTRLIAIGDIHGCDAALAAVLEAVAAAESDRLVFLGDYIDRGPDSRQVIDRLISLQKTFDTVTLLGNHEEMMLRAVRGQSPLGWWTRHGGEETLESYGYNGSGDFSVIPDEHLNFLDNCLNSYATGDFFFVHANYVEEELLKHQPAEALRWQALMERTPGPHFSGRTAIVGHTAQRSGEVLDLGHLRCLDTYCHGGGWLTAMDVLTSEVWQADRTGRMRSQG